MAKKFVGLLGVVFILLGIIGFFVQFDGIFHLTPMHNIVHLVSGIIALICTTSEARAAAYAKIFGFVYLLVGIIGMFTHEFAGIIFLFADNILHFLIAFASIYIGFSSSSMLRNVPKNVTH
ncbi:DUF4383 domain-containing protein [Falsibacillus pallidus]|uniref:Uncharacterized protein DUF4383 n=1 Tax=Falsibacillus pallidus TaxID=493781 RepID=A0A370GSG1_9BACI|nr:DUF4383 domain-containing protein [Falsibacillus pallidus]RDI45444.1 uncharacterized protein DUF4383 [Falsibacillus pallidus]